MSEQEKPKPFSPPETREESVKKRKATSGLEHTMDFDSVEVELPVAGERAEVGRATTEEKKGRRFSTDEDHAKAVDEKFLRFQSFQELNAVKEEGHLTQEVGQSDPRGIPTGIAVEGASPEFGPPSGEFISKDSSSPKVTDPFLGQVVNGRYVVESLLGEGGMGKVYLARQVGLERPVALKMLHSHIALDGIRRERFHREAKAMTKVSHPGAVVVYDFGEWQGYSFIAMEVVKGRPLSELMLEEAPMPAARIVEILAEVCAALDAAHRVGLIHRDLKPENIMMLEDKSGPSRIKIVDFGLALLKEGEAQQRLTQEGTLVGTPAYVSPEQAQGHEVDGRGDLYAVGVMLYEMLCGMLPFLGDNMMSLMLQHMFAPAQPPSERKPDLSINPVLEALAMRALSKLPGDRPATAADFRETLLSALDEEGSISERKRLFEHGSRDARASAAGLPPISAPESSMGAKLPKHSLMVIEEQKGHMESIIVGMWSNGFKARQVKDLAEALDGFSGLGEEIVRGIVFDITPAPKESLELIERAREIELAGIAFVIIGPADEFELMSRSVEMGAEDYVSMGEVHQRLPKTLKRTIKRMARQLKKR